MRKTVDISEFNRMKPLFKEGDAVRLAEISGKSWQICSHIITGIRNPQPWFMEAAKKYLEVLGRLPKVNNLAVGRIYRYIDKETNSDAVYCEYKGGKHVFCSESGYTIYLTDEQVEESIEEIETDPL